MRETPDELAWLQALLDDSYARGGRHLRAIHTPAARVSAAQVVEELTGMQVFVVATVSADGRPFTGPVDAFLYRGRVCFGTAPDAVRARHLSRSPAVSATHVRGEGLVVTVHGRVRHLDLDGADRGFAEVVEDHYGVPVEDWGGPGGAYAWAIEPDRMLAADMTVHQSAV